MTTSDHAVSPPLAPPVAPMPPLLRSICFGVDRLNQAVGKLIGWLILVLTLVTSYDIVARKFFSAPLRWSYDVSYILYGTLFMMAGAYTLSRNAHVRGDMFYSRFTPRKQAIFDLVLYVCFFYPGVIALVYSGYDYAFRSMVIGERSAVMANGIYIWPFKFVIPISGAFMLLQGVVETIRCIECVRTGEWPKRLADTEETETRLAQETQL